MIIFTSQGDLSLLFHFGGYSSSGYGRRPKGLPHSHPLWDSASHPYGQKSTVLSPWGLKATKCANTRDSRPTCIPRGYDCQKPNACLLFFPLPLNAVDIRAKSAQGMFHLNCTSVWVLGDFHMNSGLRFPTKQCQAGELRAANFCDSSFTLGYTHPSVCNALQKARLRLGSDLVVSLLPTNNSKAKETREFFLPSASTKDTVSLYPCWKTL